MKTGENLSERIGENLPMSRAFRITISVALIVLAFACALAFMFYYTKHVDSTLASRATQAVAEAVKAQRTADQGRSLSLCKALLELAKTHAAHKLHPIFVKVYNSSGCTSIMK